MHNRKLKKKHIQTTVYGNRLRHKQKFNAHPPSNHRLFSITCRMSRKDVSGARVPRKLNSSFTMRERICVKDWSCRCSAPRSFLIEAALLKGGGKNFSPTEKNLAYLRAKGLNLFSSFLFLENLERKGTTLHEKWLVQHVLVIKKALINL